MAHGITWAADPLDPEAESYDGAAGVGLALLHLDGAINGRADRIALPANPRRVA